VVLFDVGLVGRFVGRDEGYAGAVRAPGKLLDSQRRAGDLLRLATVHGQHKDLLGGFLFFASFRKECQPIAGLETSTIFCTSPISNFRGWASARPSAAMARSAARIPTRDFPANGAEFLVFVGMTRSPASASGMNFD
jgi:hypothetical protein